MENEIKQLDGSKIIKNYTLGKNKISINYLDGSVLVLKNSKVLADKIRERMKNQKSTKNDFYSSDSNVRKFNIGLASKKILNSVIGPIAWLCSKAMFVFEIIFIVDIIELLLMGNAVPSSLIVLTLVLPFAKSYISTYSRSLIFNNGKIESKVRLTQDDSIKNKKNYKLAIRNTVSVCSFGSITVDKELSCEQEITTDTADQLVTAECFDSLLDEYLTPNRLRYSKLVNIKQTRQVLNKLKDLGITDLSLLCDEKEPKITQSKSFQKTL